MGLFDKIFGGKDEDAAAAEGSEPAEGAKPTAAQSEASNKPAASGSSQARTAKSSRETAKSSPETSPRPAQAARPPLPNAPQAPAPALQSTPDNDAGGAPERKAPQPRAQAPAPKADAKKPPPLRPQSAQAKGTPTPTRLEKPVAPVPKPAAGARKPMASETATAARSPQVPAATSQASATTQASAPSQASATTQASAQSASKPSAAKPAEAWPTPKTAVGLGALSSRDSKDDVTAQLSHPAPTEGRSPSPAPAQPDRATQLSSLRERTHKHLAHIEQFVFDLELRCAPIPWANPCREAVEAISRVADELALQDVHNAAQELLSTLTALARTANGSLDADACQQVSARYGALVRAVGEPLRAAPPATETEPLLLDAMLRSVEGVHALTLDKLEKAGVLSLGALAKENADTLAERAGLDAALVERIVQQVETTRSGHGKANAGELRARLIDQARDGLASLEDAHTSFLEAEQAEDGKGKRQARRDRDAALLNLSGLFARLGELEPAREMQRGSLPQRIERARSWVSKWSR